MRKVNRKPANDMLPEYDFASMKGGVRGKYAAQYRAGTNLVLLDPEVAEAFSHRSRCQSGAACGAEYGEGRAGA